MALLVSPGFTHSPVVGRELEQFLLGCLQWVHMSV